MCNLLINQYGSWESGTVSDNNLYDKRSRQSDVSWIEETFWLSSFFKIMSDANQNSGLNFNITDITPMQLTRYVAPDGHYDFHLDSNGHTKNPDGVVRKLSMTILLNDSKDFEGGQLEFFTTNKPHPVNLEKGDVVIFPSFYLHRVTPVKKGTRYSLVGWVTGEPFK